MTVKFKSGMNGTATAIVAPSNFASTMGSGDLDVFATPALVALMEKAACSAVADCFDATTGSVGIKMAITHDAATPPGKKVTATAELLAVEGRRLIFAVSAVDEHGLIGSGRHERFVIDKAKFLAKLQAKS